MTSKQNLSRREVLKSMTALGGAVAATSFLPDEWIKPEVGAGVLPVHAQATACVPSDVACEIGEPGFTQQEETLVPYTIQLIPPCPGVEVVGTITATGEVNDVQAIMGTTNDQGIVSGEVIFPFWITNYVSFELVVTQPFDCTDLYIVPQIQ